jgi:hypothetical protein
VVRELRRRLRPHRRRVLQELRLLCALKTSILTSAPFLTLLSSKGAARTPRVPLLRPAEVPSVAGRVRHSAHTGRKVVLDRSRAGEGRRD